VSQEEVAEEGEREEAVDENVGTEDHPRGASNQRRTLGIYAAKWKLKYAEAWV
jgi:hypothetical protein